MRVAVYLGSHDGNRPVYRQTAYELGYRLALAGIGVVYGGAGIGTMEALADGVAAAGGECTGVFPEGFKGRPDVAAAGIDIRQCVLTTDIIVRDFPERKKEMERLSDCCIALPGSWGTLDELFTYATDTQLGFNGGKRVFVLNLDGYYDSLITLIRNMYEEGFIDASSLDLITFVTSVDEFLSILSKLA